ncbi:hypothetical protein ABE288_02445 [Bacillus salipaludis]|uniref:hypothetical protein n=1 Tax=Bacillus salipaludis TaxID=2547811 RepID=UPI003D1DF16F
MRNALGFLKIQAFFNLSAHFSLLSANRNSLTANQVNLSANPRQSRAAKAP